MNTSHLTLYVSALGVLAVLLVSGCAKPAPQAPTTPIEATEAVPAALAVSAPAPKTQGHRPKDAPPSGASLAPIPKDAVEVEASCGQCQFGLTEPKGCDLAVRIEGKAYFVDGSHIDDHGDAHATRGMCNAIRRAAVTGEVVKDRFVAKTFRVID